MNKLSIISVFNANPINNTTLRKGYIQYASYLFSSFLASRISFVTIDTNTSKNKSVTVDESIAYFPNSGINLTNIKSLLKIISYSLIETDNLSPALSLPGITRKRKQISKGFLPAGNPGSSVYDLYIYLSSSARKISSYLRMISLPVASLQSFFAVSFNFLNNSWLASIRDT